MWDNSALALALSEREAGWWDPMLRNDALWRATVLADEFVEISSSGRVRRIQDLGVAGPDELDVEVVAPIMRRLAPRVALVSYLATRRRGTGQSCHHASLWIQHEDDWRMHVHQYAVAAVVRKAAPVLHAVA